MDASKRHTMHLYGDTKMTPVMMTEGMREIFREVGNGKISEGIRKLSICACIIKDLDGRSFDRGYWRLIRTIAIMEEKDDGDMVEGLKIAAKELEELEAQVREDEAALTMKKFNLGVAKMKQQLNEE
jgi:hypothetical protein